MRADTGSHLKEYRNPPFATVRAGSRYHPMAELSSIAVTHDGWFREPAIRHFNVAALLWWRHIRRHQPWVVNCLEWTVAAALAVILVTTELIVSG
jgi:hypothetical protein